MNAPGFYSIYDSSHRWPALCVAGYAWPLSSRRRLL